MMVKGITPTRARRRQSDAKWRASVAMCYEIMKNVIPRQKLGRKKLSKALTLKETERHIVCLERKLKDLLQDKAPMLGKIVMAEKENGCVHPASFEDIRKDFAVKQLSFFASNSTGNGKKRYNIPADIEASFDNLSRQSSSLVVMNRSEMKTLPVTQPPKLYKATTETPAQPDPIILGGKVTPKAASSTISSESKTTHKADTVLRIQTPLKRRVTPGVLTHTRPRCDIVTPKKTTTKHRSTSTSTESPWGREKSTYKTPSKACKQLPFGPSPSGFTPIKLPLGLYGVDQLPATPAKSLIGSPFSCFSTLPETPSSCFNGVEYLDVTDDEAVSLLCPEPTLWCPEPTLLCPEPTLLCTESIDIYEDGTGDSRSLPDACKTEPGDQEEESFYSPINSLHAGLEGGLKSKREAKCRRRLDTMYEDEKSTETEKCNDESCLDFDGYLMFYRHHLSDDLSGSPAGEARGIASMWESLNADERATYTSIATIDNSDDSNDLSDDLIGIDLNPLMKNSYASERQDSSTMSQEVPDMDMMSDPSHYDNQFHLVPEYEDLGIIYTDHFEKEANLSPRKMINKELPGDSQVVPDGGVAF